MQNACPTPRSSHNLLENSFYFRTHSPWSKAATTKPNNPGQYRLHSLSAGKEPEPRVIPTESHQRDYCDQTRWRITRLTLHFTERPGGRALGEQETRPGWSSKLLDHEQLRAQITLSYLQSLATALFCNVARVYDPLSHNRRLLGVFRYTVLGIKGNQPRTRNEGKNMKHKTEPEARRVRRKVWCSSKLQGACARVSIDAPTTYLSSNSRNSGRCTDTPSMTQPSTDHSLARLGTSRTTESVRTTRLIPMLSCHCTNLSTIALRLWNLVLHY